MHGSFLYETNTVSSCNVSSSFHYLLSEVTPDSFGQTSRCCFHTSYHPGLTYIARLIWKGFPGGSVVKNPPSKAGDMGSIPDPGRSHVSWSSTTIEPVPIAWEPQVLNPRAETTEAGGPWSLCCSRKRPGSLELEKSLCEGDPATAANK